MNVELNNNNELCFLDDKGGVLLALPYKQARRIGGLVKGESEEVVRIGSNFFSFESDFFVAEIPNRGKWATDNTSELVDILDTLKELYIEVADFG